MSNNNNNTEANSFTSKRVKPRYIVVNEDINDSLDPFTLKIYQTLRYQADYSSECSSIKRNVTSICNKVGLSRRQVFYSISILESVGLLKRESTPGQQSTYWIAQELGYFTAKETSVNAESPTEKPPVHDVHEGVHDVHGVVHHMHTIIINPSTNTSKDLKTLVDSKKSTNYKEDNLFMLFYSSYPNKQKPEAAHKAFKKLRANEEIVEMLVKDVLLRRENNWKGRPKDKIPHPSTYLNNKEWEGEIYPPESNVSNFPNKPPRYTMHELMDGVL